MPPVQVVLAAGFCATTNPVGRVSVKDTSVNGEALLLVKTIVKVVAAPIPLDAVPISVQKAVVPLFKLTDVRWIDETQSIVEYRFTPQGVFYWRSLNSPTKGIGKYEVKGKKSIILYYKYDIMEKTFDGAVEEDTFNIARMETLRVVSAPDGSIYLVTEDGVKLYPEIKSTEEE